jgi:hypothetical protein
VLVMPTCPECAQPGIPLMFGLPIPEACEAARAGQLALGGCLLPYDPPNWQCPDGHRWRNADEEMWDARLLAVLVAHGYDRSIDDEILDQSS